MHSDEINERPILKGSDFFCLFFVFRDTAGRLDPNCVSEEIDFGGDKMIEIEQSAALNMIKSVGKEAWYVYSGLKYMAVDSYVNLTQDQICELLGITKRVFQRHIKVLQMYRVGDDVLVRVESTADGHSYVVQEFSIKCNSTPLLVAPARTPRMTPSNELFDHWLIAYHEAYGDAYQVANFGKEKGHVRTLATRYEGNVELVKAIMDVVIRLYPVRWKSAQYTRPTLGALVSWLAAQAEPMAKANLEAAADADVQITAVDEDDDVFAKYDKAWGLS